MTFCFNILSLSHLCWLISYGHTVSACHPGDPKKFLWAPSCSDATQHCLAEVVRPKAHLLTTRFGAHEMWDDSLYRSSGKQFPAQRVQFRRFQQETLNWPLLILILSIRTFQSCKGAASAFWLFFVCPLPVLFFPHPEKWELSLYVARRTVDMTDMLWCSSFIYSYADHTKHTKHTTLHTIFDPSPTQSLPKGRPLNTTTDLLPKKNETKISKKLKVGGSFEPPILKNLLVKLDDFPYFAGHKYSKSLKKKLHHLVSPIFWEIPPPKKVKKNVVESLGPVKTLAHSR